MKKINLISKCPIILILLFEILTVGCNSKKGGSPSQVQASQIGMESPVQSIEITIDDQRYNIISSTDTSNSAAEMGIVAGGFNSDPGKFGIVVQRLKESFELTVEAKLDKLTPGTYDAFRCLDDECEDYDLETEFFPQGRDHAKADSNHYWSVKSAKLGLNPMKLTITSVEDMTSQGSIGPLKRVKGTFKGMMARLDLRGDPAEFYVVGPLKKIEGSFNVIASLD